MCMYAMSLYIEGDEPGALELAMLTAVLTLMESDGRLLFDCVLVARTQAFSGSWNPQYLSDRNKP